MSDEGISIHKMALTIHSMAESAWEQEHGEYPKDNEINDAIKGVLSELHKELITVIKEYNNQ